MANNENNELKGLSGASRTRRGMPPEIGIFSIVVVVFIVFSILSAPFHTISNVFTLLLNVSVVGFLALGQTFVLLTGGIDLSTGSVVAMTNVLAAAFMQSGLPWPVAVILSIAAGMCIGLINGILVDRVGLPPFIATFGTLGIAESIPQIITGANSIDISNTAFGFIGGGKLLGIPFAVILLVVFAVISALFLARTAMGVHIYATSGNRNAARLAGVSVTRVTIFVYVASSIAASIGGLIDASRLMVGYPFAGTGNSLFFSIAAAVVGGVSLFGGTGTVLGAMIGAVLIGIVSNGLNVLDVSSYWQPLVIGVIILLGVALDTLRARRAGGSRVPRREKSRAAAETHGSTSGAATG